MARAAWNIGSSMLTRALSPDKAAFDGIGITKPHVWKARCGISDMDVNLHLNNASYLYNMDLARWHLSGLSGLLHHCLTRGWMILVGSQSIRYRHSIAPFQLYEIHSEIVYWDDKWFYFVHRFVCPKTGKLFAEGLSRCMVKDRNRTTIPFVDVTQQIGLGTPEPKAMPDVVRSFLEWDAATKASTDTWAPADHVRA